MQQDIVLFSKNGYVVLVLAPRIFDGLRDLNGHSTVVAENYLRDTCLWEETAECAPEYFKDVENMEFSKHSKTFFRTIERKVVIVNPSDEKKQDLEGLKKYLEMYGKKIVLAESVDHITVTCPTNFVTGIVSLVEKYGYWASEIQEAPDLTAKDVEIPRTEKPAEKRKLYPMDNLFGLFIAAATSEYWFFKIMLWIFSVLAPTLITATILAVASLLIAKAAGDFDLWWILPVAGFAITFLICQIIWAERNKQGMKPVSN